MDRRRRYIPSPDGLETRTMLSTTNSGLGFFGGGLSTTQNLPVTFQQKSQRIQKVPQNLRALEPSRFLPVDTVQQIQTGLFQVMGQMHQPPPQTLSSYNLAMRNIVFHSALTPQNAQLLLHSFNGVLKAAGTPPAGLNTLTTAMRQLVTQVDTASVNPVSLATNDASYILQLALVLGQRLPAPQAPTIVQTSGTEIKPGASVTPLMHPVFSGSYNYGTTVRIVDPAHNNAVIGAGVVSKNGQYQIKVDMPLQAGTTYRLRLQAVDEVQHPSKLSRQFVVKVVPPRRQAVTVGAATPGGPLTTSR
jgi:hypothetical protein